MAFAQLENDSSKRVSLQFEGYFNSGEYEMIFEMFSSDMKSYLTREKTIEFLKGVKKSAGKIQSRKFVKYDKRSFASYKTKFDYVTFEVNISIDDKEKINGLSIKPFSEDRSPNFERNITKMYLPFTGEWTVIWGGDTKEQNHHHLNKAQNFAFDIVITDDVGKSYKTNGKHNEDYYAFGKELLAPCDAEVVMVVDGIKDNIPGNVNPIYVPGNTVVLKTVKNEFIFFAHFKQHSIVVKEGEKVTVGDTLGLCGNSGNSTEAHLHFHVQDVEDMNEAIGVKCYFNSIYVNGVLRNDYSPLKSEKVNNK